MNARPPPPPPDPALPTMAALLDPDEMAPVLQRSLGSASPPEVRVHYLRYKPATNLVVHYHVGPASHLHHASAMIASRDFLARRAAKPEHVALARRVDGRSPAVTPLSYAEDLGAMLQWLPLDIALPGLATLASELPGPPTILAYKPRRRAVVRLGASVLKLYARQIDFEHASRALHQTSAVRGLRTARFQRSVPGLRLTAQRDLDGHEFAPTVEDARRAGAALARLHASDLAGLDEAPPTRQLEAARASARLARIVVPTLAPRVDWLIRRLAQLLPDAGDLVPSHGDFSPHQLLAGQVCPALIDFDELCAAPRSLDLATYAAYLLRGAPDRDAARAATEALLEGYASRAPAFQWYMASALVRRAPAPFRRQEQDWPAQVEHMIATAHAALRE